jgi:uncharacterized protein
MFDKQNNLNENNFKVDKFSAFRGPLGNLGLLFVIILLLSIIGALLIFCINGGDLGFGSMQTESDRNLFRLTAFINHLTMFLMPPILTAYLLKENDWKNHISLVKTRRIDYFVLGFFLMIVSFPLVQYLMELNKMIPMPEWMHSMETSTNDAIKNVLKTDSIYELFLNVFIMAAVPAMGEEMVFRGFLQKQLQAHFNHNHVGIWLSAAIFSAIHGQFEGFFSRLVMGAILGYIFYFGRSLWVSIFAHFSFNALQIIGQYFINKNNMDIDTDKTDNLQWYWVLSSFLLTMIILTWFHREYEKSNKNDPSNAINS